MADEMEKLKKNIAGLDSAITKRLRSKLRIWGIRIKQQIQSRTKEGQGVSKKRGEPKPFKPLQQSTVEHRQQLKNKGQLSADTDPNTSNQIESGKLVNNMELKVNLPALTIEISPSQDRIEVAKGQKDQGRSVFNLSEEEFRKLEEDIKKEVADVVIKIFK